MICTLYKGREFQQLEELIWVDLITALTTTIPEYVGGEGHQADCNATLEFVTGIGNLV